MNPKRWKKPNEEQRTRYKKSLIGIYDLSRRIFAILDEQEKWAGIDVLEYDFSTIKREWHITKIRFYKNRRLMNIVEQHLGIITKPGVRESILLERDNSKIDVQAFVKIWGRGWVAVSKEDIVEHDNDPDVISDREKWGLKNEFSNDQIG
jgi:hypothetical protein